MREVAFSRIRKALGLNDKPVQGYRSCSVWNPNLSQAILLLLGLLGCASLGWSEQRILLGKVVPLPNTVVEVYSPATGRILSARAEPYMVGDLVQQGEPLAVIEHHYTLHDSAHLSTIRWDMLKLVIEARRVALEARIAREKAERMMELGSVSGQRVQELKAAEMVAQGEYEKQKNLLEYQDAQMQGAALVRRAIVAPITGDISLANFTQSQLINEGTLLYRIVSMKEIGVSARVPEVEYSSWTPEARVQIRFDSLPGKVFTGRLEISPPLVDPQSRTRDVIFRVENSGEYLRFGMIGQVELRGP
ncbi:MAG: efflux RND transporter periplasmic adaptor subunit [Acidobacteria bacterium]|nr:efflux RND transporter periplasmic adaptor subunit [Acidobacteriota bacterium]